MSQETPASQTEARIKTKRRISPFWLLPVIALLIAAWLIWTSFDDRGSTITIDFQSANGIVPGRTPIRYQGVEVGTVQDISLSKDLSKIEVSASIKRDMKDALRKETQFWLVTPKASLAGVSGLDALVGGNYIGMMPGKGEPEDHFVALDTQPKYRINNGELMIHLQAPDLGSLNSGSLVYFRKIPVGRVYDYSLNANNQGVTIDVLIERRFTNLVKKGSRFWNVSGVKADVGLSGAYINVEPGRGPARRDFEIQDTTISDSRYIDGLNIVVEAPEAGSLGIGTPVLFRGLEVGTVTGLSLGSMSDRVMVKLRISKRYQYLVRNNSVFWLASGYSLDFGLIGGVVKTGTFNQFIRGGIAFATPPGTPLAPKAQDGKHFLLQESEPKEWREWGTALPQ